MSSGASVVLWLVSALPWLVWLWLLVVVVCLPDRGDLNHLLLGVCLGRVAFFHSSAGCELLSCGAICSAICLSSLISLAREFPSFLLQSRDCNTSQCKWRVDVWLLEMGPS